MSTTNKVADTAVETEKTLHPAEVERLVEQGKQLDGVADYVYEVMLPRLNLLLGNIIALDKLSAMEYSREIAEAKAAIINTLFTLQSDLQYDCELISELHLDELAERYATDATKVLR